MNTQAILTMHTKHILFTITVALLLGLSSASAQILSIDPIFPRDNDTVTIIYDASQGNGALAGFVPVYAHTGVITSASSSPTDWRHVQGNWGTADANVVMSSLGNNRHEITYQIRNFYGAPVNETIERMAFVFRNTDGSVVGRDFDGSDIFTPVYGPGLFTKFVTPDPTPVIAAIGDTLDIFAAASDQSTLTITDNGTQIHTVSSTTQTNYDLVVSTGGSHEVILTAFDGMNTARDTFLYVVNPTVNPVDPPSGTELGITYLNNTDVRLRLRAPNKGYVYVLGDFNNYTPDPAYFMNKSVNGEDFWIDISGLTAGQVYTFQYLIDGDLRVADPHSEIVLDPNNDQFIPAQTYPNLPSYPAGGQGIVTVIEPGKTPYVWQNPTFSAPQETDLVIYELLPRDFIAAHDYQTLLDTLDYLEDLGINAIQFMPVNEFEGNESWGYNPSFHMALDKYYGTPDTFKAFIDECHGRGIAVILDVVYNHAFSQSPLCQLYWDPTNFKPRSDNPWLNPDPRHDFNVGYDFNHESQHTKDWLDRVMTYWIEEYHVDGFRYDLSKGFTQNNTLGNIGAWNAYDQSRVDLLQRIKDVCRNSDNDFYLILEHLADNGEETELANRGFMLWGNLNHNYNQATMGYSQDYDFSWGSYQFRGWNDPKLVTYMESHDEERLMFKNLEFGNNNGAGCNVKNLGTALDRLELAGALFFTIPGPKMIWQFGELGYDVSIDDPCRVCNKPILWNYNTEADRRDLYNAWSAMIQLRQTYSTFRTRNYSINFGGAVKSIKLDDPAMNAIAIGNFNVNTSNGTPGFHQAGWWYDYMTGDSIYVNGSGDQVSLAAGEYHIYTDVKLPVPNFPTSTEETVETLKDGFQIFPNPSAGETHVRYHVSRPGNVELSVYDLMGKRVAILTNEAQLAGSHDAHWNGMTTEGTLVPAGTYVLRLQTPRGIQSKKLIRVQ